ncbi:hypothetical protein DRO59_06755 [Candidatus Bathyarchaeota archaeon]|nr:MAG: hypothetical protein DRO59_06755 [Candidatus Bathyarchaeota archaeon]
MSKRYQSNINKHICESNPHIKFAQIAFIISVCARINYPPKAVGKQEWVTAFQNGFCECTYMWARLIRGRLESLGYQAIHIKV